MRFRLVIAKSHHRSLVIEPWGEEFSILSKRVEIVFRSVAASYDCEVEIDFSEEGFLRIENPLGFRPIVLIDGREDERPAFAS
jgi:hypothetical protein